MSGSLISICHLHSSLLCNIPYSRVPGTRPGAPVEGPLFCLHMPSGLLGSLLSSIQWLSHRQHGCLRLGQVQKPPQGCQAPQRVVLMLTSPFSSIRPVPKVPSAGVSLRRGPHRAPPPPQPAAPAWPTQLLEGRQARACRDKGNIPAQGPTG